MKKVNTPFRKQDILNLHAGNRVLLTGTVYTARDAAHKRLVQLIEKGEDLPFRPQGAAIYYVGPTPAPLGKVIGSAGPTTSYRMDAYAPKLLELGVMGMIGKGMRSQNVIDSMKQNGAVYFAAMGGAGALISKCIVKSEIIAYEDLGSEAIRKIEVVDLPLVVAIDSYGNSIYTEGPKAYLQSLTEAAI